MKKLLLVALLMLALVITAVACNNEPADTTGETTATQTPATAEPADSTAAPETPTEAPEVPTEAPEVPTQAPEVPTDAPVTQAPVVTTEPETDAPVDPADPVHIIDAAALAGCTNLNAATIELNEAGYASFTATSGDPWALISGNIGAMPEYLAISYRTNTNQTGEFFIGNGAGPEGGKSFVFEYNANSEWNLLIFHLPTVAPYMTDNTVGHIRFDFYTGGAEEAIMDVEYVAFFNTAEYAEAYHFKKHPAYVSTTEAGMVNHSIDSFLVNEELYFQPDGGHGDKLTAQNNIVNLVDRTGLETITLRGWIGFGQPIESFGYFVDNYNMVYAPEFTQPAEAAVIGLAGEHASRFHISVPVAALEAGAHKVGFVVKLADGTVAILRDTIQVILPWTAPVHTDETVELGVRGNGGPFNAPSEKKFGQRFNIGENFLKSINITDMATYANSVNTWAFRIWAWNTDYATTTAADPIAVFTGKDHPDNTTFTIDNLVGYGITGDFFYEIEYVEGSAGFTGWTAEASVAEGVETYVSGNLATGSYSSTIVVGVPGVADVTVDGDFSDWADKVVTDIPVSKFIAWTGTAPEAFNLKTSFTSDGEYLYVYLNPGENSGVTMYQICLITDNTVASDAAQAWYNVTFADGVASIAGATGACKGEAKVFMTGTEVEAAIPIAAIYGEGFALPVETRVLLVAQINSGTHMGTFHDGKNPNDDGWADRTGDGCPLTLNADGTYTIDLPGENEPEAPVVENVVIDLSTIEGYRAENNYGYDGPILNIGYDTVFLVGEFDLNQYSQIIIEYSYDGDTVVENKPVEQNWTECGRAPIIGFTALNKCFGYANVTNQDAIDNGIYVDMPHTPGNWSAATRTATIEVPENIGYSGPCYISAYNPWFREIAIVSITLVPRA